MTIVRIVAVFLVIGFMTYSELISCTTYACDSLAVRAILDSNELFDIPVNSVSWVDTTINRVYELKLYGYGSKKNISDTLKILPEDIGELTKLRSLYLANNRLITLPNAIENLSILRLLDLSNNRLTTLPVSFWKLTNLQILSLSNNRLTSIPDAIRNFTKLSLLYLNYNQLTTLPNAIGNLAVLLRTLSLSNNQLINLPDAFGDLIYLTFLNLTDNQLTALPGSIYKITNLQTLHLSLNNLCSLTPIVETWADTNDPDWRDTQDCTNVIHEIVNSSYQIQNTNSVNTFLDKKITVFNIQGKQVTSALTPGIYFIKEANEIKKVVVVK